MDKLRIVGDLPISGEMIVSGAKNAGALEKS